MLRGRGRPPSRAFARVVHRGDRGGCNIRGIKSGVAVGRGGGRTFFELQGTAGALPTDGRHPRRGRNRGRRAAS